MSSWAVLHIPRESFSFLNVPPDLRIVDGNWGDCSEQQ